MKITYISNATLTNIQGTGKYFLFAPVVYHINGKGQSVPRGFKTDLATIPRPLWSFIASDDKGILEASIIHDYLYSSKDSQFSRKDADDLLLAGMDYLGKFCWLKKRMVYVAVRALGWIWWKS